MHVFLSSPPPLLLPLIRIILILPHSPACSSISFYQLINSPLSFFRRYNEACRVFHESPGCVVILYGRHYSRYRESCGKRRRYANGSAHACMRPLHTSVIVSRRCTRVTHYMYHITHSACTHARVHPSSSGCTWRRDKTQSTRKTGPARLFADFYRLPIATNRFGGIPVVPFYLRTDPLAQVTPLSTIRLRPFFAPWNRTRRSPS